MKNLNQIVIELIAQTLNVSEEELDMNSRIDETQNWDSLTNMDLLLVIEKFFSIRFELDELQNLNSIKNIYENLENRDLN